ncbi:MAG: hypothetical protein HRT70_07860 [Flavobacteriaceae bacterium]|nr:hypothetical protein [Flavobacteriaceae bacterium]
MSKSQQNLKALNELLSHEWMTPKRMMYLLSRQFAFANLHEVYTSCSEADREEIAFFNSHFIEFISKLSPEQIPTD